MKRKRNRYLQIFDKRNRAITEGRTSKPSPSISTARTRLRSLRATASFGVKQDGKKVQPICIDTLKLKKKKKPMKSDALFDMVDLEGL